jgi:hypothetical protein
MERRRTSVVSRRLIGRVGPRPVAVVTVPGESSNCDQDEAESETGDGVRQEINQDDTGKGRSDADGMVGDLLARSVKVRNSARMAMTTIGM